MSVYYHSEFIKSLYVTVNQSNNLNKGDHLESTPVRVTYRNSYFRSRYALEINTSPPNLRGLNFLKCDSLKEQCRCLCLRVLPGASSLNEGIQNPSCLSLCAVTTPQVLENFLYIVCISLAGEKYKANGEHQGYILHQVVCKPFPTFLGTNQFPAPNDERQIET